MRSRQSLRTVRTQRSALAFAFGACTCVRITSIPWVQKYDLAANRADPVDDRVCAPHGPRKSRRIGSIRTWAGASQKPRGMLPVLVGVRWPGELDVEPLHALRHPPSRPPASYLLDCTR